MKRISIYFIFVVTIIAQMPHTAHAVGAKHNIEGYVFKEHKPIAGLPVHVYCGNPEHRYMGDSAPTTASGHYEFALDDSLCATDELLLLFADQGDWLGNTQAFYHPGHKIDINLENHASLPEYQWVTGAIAVGAGLGLVVFMRRRP